MEESILILSSPALCGRKTCRKLASFFVESGEVRTYFCDNHKPCGAVEMEDFERVGEAEALPLIIKPKGFQACSHFRQVELDPEARVVKCTGCGATLDAFEVLLDQAKHLRSLQYRIDSAADLNRKAQEKEKRRMIKDAQKRARVIAAN